jgi:hypothetical protein
VAADRSESAIVPSPTAGGHALAILVGRGWTGSTWQRSSTGHDQVQVG